MLLADDLIRIEEISVWILVPFGIALVAAVAWSIGWILRGKDLP